MTRPARLILADGTFYDGDGIGPDGFARGEAVFTTAMTGYEEALTDPSYAGQILVFCYPLIGNYGIDPAVRQHPTLCAAGAVFKRVSRHPSHHRGQGDVAGWLAASGVRALESVDTRALVTRLREAGTMRAVLAVGEAAVANAADALQSYLRCPLDTPALVETVAPTALAAHGHGSVRIGLLDYGAKAEIARCLKGANATVVDVPGSYETDDILALRLDGLVVSNGPGDPAELERAVATLRTTIERAADSLPIFGICLGHQLLAQALGARTFKLKYGHRGANQPVLDCRTNEVIITTQNHGYAVDARTLPACVEETMVNLNDGTNEGLRHRHLPIASVQFHPEAAPGPRDARHVLSDFVAQVRAARERPS